MDPRILEAAPCGGAADQDGLPEIAPRDDAAPRTPRFRKDRDTASDERAKERFPLLLSELTDAAGSLPDHGRRRGRQLACGYCARPRRVAKHVQRRERKRSEEGDRLLELRLSFRREADDDIRSDRDGAARCDSFEQC